MGDHSANNDKLESELVRVNRQTDLMALQRKRTEQTQSQQRKRIVQILSMFFGFGSWIAMTGLWVELPLLTQSLPESWSLGSYMSVMIQLANIGPLIYWYLRAHHLCTEMTAIHVQMVIGTLACLALVFWWDTTIVIGGSSRSVVLFVATFGLSIVDCTSSVTFLPYMARYQAHHLTPYLIGEGLSGFLPSLVALAQGVSDDGKNGACDTHLNYSTLDSTTQHTELVARQPRFSANVFFVFLLVILCVSWGAFILLENLPLCRQERIDLVQLQKPEVGVEELTKLESHKDELTNRSGNFQKRKLVWLLGLMSWSCFTTFGFMPSLQSYSCLPYGQDTFFYAVTLVGLAYPAACTVGLFLDPRWPSLFNSLTLIGSGIGVYIFVCATLSPFPPLKGEQIGSILMVASWISYVGVISYVKTLVSLELNDTGGNQAMFWCGISQQFGAAIGGFIIFLIINFTQVFKEETSC